MSRKLFVSAFLLFGIISYGRQTNTTDGPYVFYNSGSAQVKSVVSVNGVYKAVSDSFPEKKKGGQTITVHVARHPEWDFEVRLKRRIQIPAVITKKNTEANALILSDIEGEFEPFRNLLLVAKVIDKKYNWVFGKGKLIIAGDLFDRGKQVCQFLWLLYKLEVEANKKGGQVHVILGNHDIMNLSGDFRYVEAEYMNNAKLMNETYAALYGSNTELGKWLRSKNIIEKIDGLLVLHGGISAEINKMGMPLQQINGRCRPFYEVAGRASKITDKTLLPLFSGTTSPFWYRGYFLDPKASSRQVDSTLLLYGCKKIIVGHDIIDHVSSLYHGKVIGLDVDEHEGVHEGLLITKGRYFRIDDKGRKTELVDDTSN